MFTGFTDSDFDAYARAKWRSNTFNRERLEVKQKLIALGKVLARGLTSSDGAPLDCEASVEYPALFNQKQVDAQHLFFFRHAQARARLDRVIERKRTMASMLEDPSPQRSHIVLAASIDESSVFAGLKLHRDASVDRRNLEAVVADADLAAELARAVHELPAPLWLGVTGGPRSEPASIDVGALGELVAALGAPTPAGASRWLMAGRTIDRAGAIATGAGLADELHEALRAVVPVYRLIAWSTDNDRIAMRDELREDTVARRVRGIEKNDTVRITSGVFSGRTGIVQEVDSKGGVKVLVGNVPLKLSTAIVEKL